MLVATGIETDGITQGTVNSSTQGLGVSGGNSINVDDGSASITTTTDGNESDTNEVQELTVVATEGTYTLTFGINTTVAIAHDASAQDVENALNTLTSIIGVGEVTVVDITPTNTINSVFQITFSGTFDNVDPLVVGNDLTLFASEELTLWFGAPAIPNEITLDPFTGTDPEFFPRAIDSALITFDKLDGDGDTGAAGASDEFAIVAVHLENGSVIYFKVEGFGVGASTASEVDLNIVQGALNVNTFGGSGTETAPFVVDMALDGGRWTGTATVNDEFDHIHFLADGATDTDYRILSAQTFTESSGFDVGTTFTVVATDADGDTVSDTFDVTFDSGVVLTGTDGADVIVGNGAGQTLIGGLGDDILQGGGGDDILIGGAGTNTLDGGLGSDTADYSGADSDLGPDSDEGVVVDLTDTSLGGDGKATGEFGAVAFTDNLISIENVIGSAGKDTITGDGSDNVIEGGAGADTLSGGGQGTGGDTVSYASSSAGVTVNLTINPQVSGGDADGDVISGFENVIGSAFDDTITGDGSANVIEGGDGADTLTGGGGADTLTGGGGADTFVYEFNSNLGDVGVDGSDTIKDLDLGETLQFDDLFDSTPVTTLGGLNGLVTVVDDGTDTTITFNTGGATITLENVSTGVGAAGYDSLAELDVDYNLVVVV